MALQEGQTADQLGTPGISGVRCMSKCSFLPADDASNEPNTGYVSRLLSTNLALRGVQLRPPCGIGSHIRHLKSRNPEIPIFGSFLQSAVGGSTNHEKNKGLQKVQPSLSMSSSSSCPSMRVLSSDLAKCSSNSAAKHERTRERLQERGADSWGRSWRHRTNQMPNKVVVLPQIVKVVHSGRG